MFRFLETKRQERVIYWFWVGGGRVPGRILGGGKLGGWNIMAVFTGDGIGNWVGGNCEGVNWVGGMERVHL